MDGGMGAAAPNHGESRLRRVRRLALTLLPVFGLTACAAQSSSSSNGWYDSQNGVIPRPERIYICHAFGCARKTPFDLGRQDLNRLQALLRAGAKSPAAERAAVARAVAWMENRVAKQVGSQDDRGGLDLQGSGVPGQMDCIDEATNTTSLLLLAEARGWLRHHSVRAPVARGFLLDGRYPHATAVLREKGGKDFAIDSWPRANGLQPVVQPLDDWFRSRAVS
ncbi:hypothetical protein [Pannonibacter carbonis]|uniref:hypothetical protein n=1 Tax=Pannonibacter carbonis TaxID=2067569 RepID=UPI001AD8EDF0|nr:hypothetical protein [Pannonibacter carbonis]